MTKGEQTRREIVDRAFALAGEVGLEGLSLGALAADLELSKSGLFAHFRSKEALQLAVLHRAIERFVGEVVLPAFAQPRGEPRVRALLDRYIAWIRGPERQGSCFFMALTQEFDDRPGAVRDLLVESQRDWRRTLGRAALLAVEQGHFRADLDAEQFAFEVVGICMSFQQTYKLLGDADAERHARTAFAALLLRSAAPAPRPGRRADASGRASAQSQSPELEPKARA
jgi:AcrR family transcriptional regulator